MTRPRTPKERAQIVARYQETANASAVAREFDLTESAVRKILRAVSSATKSDLHARAVSQAIRKARRSLARKVDTLDAYLEKHSTDGVPNLEPRDLAAVLNSSATLLAKLLDTEERIDSRQAARLTRDLKRKEIELAQLKIAAGGVEKHEHAIALSPAAIAAEVFGSTSNLSRDADAPADAEHSAPERDG
jgi:hypothetical protein